MKDVRPRTQGPEPSAARLAPRAFSAGVVDSLGEGFVCCHSIAWFIQARTKVSDIYRMLPGADLNREQLVKINPRRLVYFIL